MKKLFKGFFMSFGMFCAIPLPFHIWDESCVNLVLPFLPVIGGIIGLLWYGYAKLLAYGGIHIMAASALLAMLPFMASGFLHLDGYMDTSDAVLSRRPLEDKLRILKDPHTGSFSVIMLAVLFILQFASAYAVMENTGLFLLLITIPVVSRCCAAISILGLKTMSQSGYANMFKSNTGISHKIFIIIPGIAGIFFSYYFAGAKGLIVSALVITGFSAAMAYAYNELKGVSGDLAGFAITIGEMCGLFAMAIK